MRLKSVRSLNGMVAAGHPLAAAEGLAVLRAGGNACDAAIAAAAVLAVVSPHECGLGGDLLAVFHDARTGATEALNASGRSPATATLERYAGGMPMLGGGSVSVPGMIGGWEAAVRRHGTRPLGELLARAIAYADEGFAVYDGLVDNIGERVDAISRNAPCRAMFLPDGQPLREGRRLRQPGAAASLRAVASDGAIAFYRGPFADAIARCVQSDGGCLSAADLAAFEPLWQPVIEAPFRGYRVCTMPPNSWAAALLVQLALIEHEGAARPDDEVAFLLQGIRTRRAAYAALAGCVADPSVVGDRAREVVARKTTLPGSSDGAMSTGLDGTDTSNVVVVDAQGNAVSLLQSVFVPFGSGLLEPISGALLNNRMRGFGTKSDDPNCVGPSKRPAQTLTPVLVLNGDAAWLACSTPGGPGQTGTVAQLLCRVLAHDQAMADAIAAPRWSMMLTGDYILEDTVVDAVRDAILRAESSVTVKPWGSVNFGSLVGIMRAGDGWIGCVDARRNAAVTGY